MRMSLGKLTVSALYEKKDSETTRIVHSNRLDRVLCTYRDYANEKRHMICLANSTSSICMLSQLSDEVVHVSEQFRWERENEQEEKKMVQVGATEEVFDLFVGTIMAYKMALCFYRICTRNRGFLVAFSTSTWFFSNLNLRCFGMVFRLMSPSANKGTAFRIAIVFFFIAISTTRSVTGVFCFQYLKSKMVLQVFSSTRKKRRINCA